MHSLQRECGYWYSPKGMLPSSVSKQPTGEQKKGNKEIKHTFPRSKQKQMQHKEINLYGMMGFMDVYPSPNPIPRYNVNMEKTFQKVPLL